MAITSFQGSGEFVPVREWTCPLHDRPSFHECDCEFCERPWNDCPSCETAEWVDATNEDGTPKMRELGFWESCLHKMYAGR